MFKSMRTIISLIAVIILSSCEEPVDYGDDLIGAWSLQSMTTGNNTENFEGVALTDAWFVNINAAAISYCWNDPDTPRYSHSTSIITEFKSDVIATSDGDIPYEIDGDHLTITVYNDLDEAADLDLIRYLGEFPPLEWINL